MSPVEIRCAKYIPSAGIALSLVSIASIDRIDGDRRTVDGDAWTTLNRRPERLRMATMTTTNDLRVGNWLGVLTVLLLAVGGLTIVKWAPYYDKAMLAAAHHSIGSSILMGSADRPPAPSLSAAIEYALAYGKSIWKAMVLGLLLGSATQTLLPRRWIRSTFGKRGLLGIVLGGIASLPTMMCTCCAAPVVAGLRECRASRGATVAFWLGNTVLNPATLIFTGFVLGWHWSAFRLVFGAIMVFGLGWLANQPESAGSIVVVATPESGSSTDEYEISFTRWLAVLGRMSIRLIPEYAVLVLLLGAARAWLFPHVGHEIDNSLIWILAFAISGALFVIPTAGEVPIVQAMLTLGVGVGPAAALLMTLPPISVPSVAMLWRSFRPRTLAAVSLGVVLIGCAAGVAAEIFLAS
jgi:uncharacterized membrane protein YraQ (UPF0718 family)